MRDPDGHIQAPNLRTREGVNVSDYYSDILLEYLIPFLEQYPKRQNLLEIGTGRGYLSIVLARENPTLRIVATDIDERALALTLENVRLNGLQGRIDVRKGNLYKPVEGEVFDFIIAVPPQIPISEEQLRDLSPLVPEYHLTTSIAGVAGRDVLDPLIAGAWKQIKPGGIISIAHADFSDVNKSIADLVSAGFKTSKIGFRRKYLSETTLTRLAKEMIEQTGYIFNKDSTGKDFFTVWVLVGIRPI